jgi:hypothetical protein
MLLLARPVPTWVVFSGKGFIYPAVVLDPGYILEDVLDPPDVLDPERIFSSMLLFARPVRMIHLLAMLTIMKKSRKSQKKVLSAQIDGIQHLFDETDLDVKRPRSLCGAAIGRAKLRWTNLHAETTICGDCRQAWAEGLANLLQAAIRQMPDRKAAIRQAMDGGAPEDEMISTIVEGIRRLEDLAEVAEATDRLAEVYKQVERRTPERWQG